MIKEILTVLLFVISGVLVVVACVYGFRSLSQVSTPISLHSPKAGVECAYMVTADGAAISCWKE